MAEIMSRDEMARALHAIEHGPEGAAAWDAGEVAAADVSDCYARIDEALREVPKIVAQLVADADGA